MSLPHLPAGTSNPPDPPDPPPAGGVQSFSQTGVPVQDLTPWTPPRPGGLRWGLSGGPDPPPRAGGGARGGSGGVQGPDPVLGHRLLAISSVIWGVWGPGGVIRGSKWGFKGGEIPLLAHLDP